MKKIISLFGLYWFCCVISFAQLSTNEQPGNFDKVLKHSIKIKKGKSIVTMPQLDMSKIEKEDLEDEEYDMPPRFGYKHKVDYNMDNSGIWYILPNGDKLWRLNVVCPNALSINFCYNKFWIPEGGKLFVYSKDKKHSVGAFTSRNNKGDRDSIRGFATGLVYGDDVILEYYQPKNVELDAIISIEYIVHGYRYINFNNRFLGSAGDCMVNVNCEEGQNWQYDKKAIAHIVLEGNYYCTGFLINTSNQSQEPFFLTANHCIERIYKDAERDTILDNTVFYWNYEVPGCINTSISPYYTTTGAIVLANNYNSDFALFRLTENPLNIIGINHFYLGWDSSGLSGNPGVCIHHPKGDVKKISTVLSQPVTSYGYHPNIDNGYFWAVSWASTLNGHGMTQGGSSGSPLLNSEHRVIGQLFGSNTQNCTNYDGQSKYGKFNRSWTGDIGDNIYRRLNCWLDSINSGVQTMDGLFVVTTTDTLDLAPQKYFNIRITSSGQLTIKNDVEMMSNNRIIVENGGMLIIDGVTLSNEELELKSGASLQIINGGIIETRNGFIAPIGVIVDIVNGQIL